MGGRIRVRSKLGEGSTFHFGLDFEIRNGNYLTRAPVVVGGTSVLIVDDNSTNRTILNEMVRSWGMIPSEAESVAEARAMLEEAVTNRAEFRLIVSDVNMPTSDGFELASYVRNNRSLSHTPIILLTSGGPHG